MIVAIGTDVVEHKITKTLNWDKDPRILNRIFSKNEIECYNSNKKLSFLTGRFAVKEAVLKCLGTGMSDGLKLTDIQTITTPNGKPTLIITGNVKTISDKMKISKWHISISHSEGFSIAYVIAESL
jgi:holo-[acyl-carrier protein] synthase